MGPQNGGVKGKRVKPFRTLLSVFAKFNNEHSSMLKVVIRSRNKFRKLDEWQIEKFKIP